jgi:hypothetical protein
MSRLQRLIDIQKMENTSSMVLMLQTQIALLFNASPSFERFVAFFLTLRYLLLNASSPSSERFVAFF